MSRPVPQSVLRNRAGVKRWKERHPEKVAAQKKRAALRKKAELRAQDPTGELAYGPIEGYDTNPDASPPAPSAQPNFTPQERRGAPDPNGALKPVVNLDNKEPAPAPRATDQARTGIEESADFADEAKRHQDFHRLRLLHNWRVKAEGKEPAGIEVDL